MERDCLRLELISDDFNATARELQDLEAVPDGTELRRMRVLLEVLNSHWADYEMLCKQIMEDLPEAQSARFKTMHREMSTRRITFISARNFAEFHQDQHSPFTTQLCRFWARRRAHTGAFSGQFSSGNFLGGCS